MGQLQKQDEPRGQVVAMNDSGALIAAIARAASDPNVDVEKMERLFAMHEKMQARQAEQAFSEAMKAAQADMPKVVKDRHNSQTNSDYATLDAINKAITPVYTRHGFSLTFDTEDSPLEGHVRVVCRVLHRDGHSASYSYDTPMDLTGIGGKVNKTPTHARGSAITYGRRYLVLMIFNLTTGAQEDDDGNGAGGFDASDWYAAIADASSMDDLNALANELKSAQIPAHVLRGIRGRWAARAKELKA
jgi:hypothetical protein